MAADYIIQSLLNLDKVKVVSFRSIEENLKYAPIGKSSGNRESFADITGAEKIIKGTFYLQSDKILMQSQVIDARSGEVERVLPEISGSEKDLQSLVKELGSRFMSYFESRDEKNSYFETAVPKYEAYIKWREVFKTWGIDVPASRKILSEAIALDSSFLLPYLYYFASYHNQGAWKEAGSFFKLIEEKFKNPSPYEQNLLQVNRAMADGNLEETALGWKKLCQKDPKNIDVNIWAAGTAMGVMRYKEALTFFQQIDPANINYDRTWKPWWTKAYAICYFRLGMYDEARKIVGYIPEKYPLHIADPLLFLFTRRGQHDSLQLFLKKLSENPVITSTQLDSLFVLAAERYALVKDTANQLIWTRLAIDRLKENPKPSHSLLIRSFYMAGEYQNALEATLKTITQNSTDWNNLSRLGRIYAKLGLHGKAMDVIHQIESVKTPFVHGENLYALAEIYAALDEKEKAVDHMKKALQAGRGMNFNYYAEDFDFIPLHGYAPYEELISPKD
jgi:tetratricopeptide (TPR) repeat protein